MAIDFSKYTFSDHPEEDRKALYGLKTKQLLKYAIPALIASLVGVLLVFIFGIPASLGAVWAIPFYLCTIACFVGFIFAMRTKNDMKIVGQNLDDIRGVVSFFVLSTMVFITLSGLFIFF